MVIESDRLVCVEEKKEDYRELDHTLRPRSLSEYIGQPDVREQMSIFIQAAKRRGEALDHTLIFGPPGLGKTTLAMILAREMGVSIRMSSGPALEKAGDLVALLTNLEPMDVLFIDEIHRLSIHIEEILYPAMEDYQVDIMIGEGPAARSVKIDLPPFTLVGATTRAGLLSSPFRDRFGIVQQLQFYAEEDLDIIVAKNCLKLEIDIDQGGSREIAKRSRGTPRIAQRLLRRVRDYADIKGDGTIDQVIADAALNMLGIDHCGFDQLDHKILRIIAKHFDGGPVGIDSLSASCGEEKGTIEEVVEPYLIQQGLLTRTPRGRILSSQGYGHLGIDTD